MDIKSHIIENIAVFDIADAAEKVREFFRESTYSHVAITENGNFAGVLAREDLAGVEKGAKISKYRAALESFYAPEEASWPEVLEIFTRNESNLLPILGKQGGVIGYFQLLDILRILIETPFFREPGGLLVIAKGGKDHSFSEIAQIIESNNARILGGFITDIQNDVVITTLKLSSENFNEVLHTFRRYNYSILFGTIHDQFLEDLKQRSDYLDKYLNV
jgi:hypothetical protein